jgi:hypothetical protein
MGVVVRRLDWRSEVSNAMIASCGRQEAAQLVKIQTT